MMDAKEHLDGIQTINRRFKKEWLKLYEMKEKAKGVSTYLGGNEKVQTSLNVDKMADMAIRIVEKEKEIKEIAREFEHEKKQAEKRLALLKKPKERDVLKLVYFKDFTFTQYAQYRGMTFAGVWMLHKRALQNISEIYENFSENS